MECGATASRSLVNIEQTLVIIKQTFLGVDIVVRVDPFTLLYEVDREHAALLVQLAVVPVIPS